MEEANFDKSLLPDDNNNNNNNNNNSNQLMLNIWSYHQLSWGTGMLGEMIGSYSNEKWSYSKFGDHRC